MIGNNRKEGENMDLQIIPVVSITVICYLIGVLCKASVHFPDKMIPPTVGIIGGILGVAAWLSIAGFPAGDWLKAMELGIVSGFASTGVNQVYKQLTKTESNGAGPEDGRKDAGE